MDGECELLKSIGDECSNLRKLTLTLSDTGVCVSTAERVLGEKIIKNDLSAYCYISIKRSFCSYIVCILCAMELGMVKTQILKTYAACAADSTGF